MDKITDEALLTTSEIDAIEHRLKARQADLVLHNSSTIALMDNETDERNHGLLDDYPHLMDDMTRLIHDLRQARTELKEREYAPQATPDFINGLKPPIRNAIPLTVKDMRHYQTILGKGYISTHAVQGNKNG